MTEYERMQPLMEAAGLSCREGGINDAEIYAYAQGIALVRQALETAENAVFTVDGNPYYAALYAMEGIGDEEERAAGIRRRAALRPCRITAGAYRDEMATAGIMQLQRNAAGEMILTLLPHRIRALSVFLRGFIPPTVTVKTDGEGMPFDAWDATGLDFNGYDRLGLPFSILDTLRRDAFEQHE